MKIDDCYYLGYISKTIGTKGELAFKLDVDSPSTYAKIQSVLIQVSPSSKTLVPYFIETATVQNNDLLRVKLEGINSQNLAKNLVGTSLFLLTELLPTLNDQQFYFHEVIGYDVVDKNKGIVGKIDKVLEFSTSNVFSIVVGEKEVLIPISDEIITHVDKAQQKITVNCPDGLIDLYLGE